MIGGCALARRPRKRLNCSLPRNQLTCDLGKLASESTKRWHAAFATRSPGAAVPEGSYRFFHRSVRKPLCADSREVGPNLHLIDASCAETAQRDPTRSRLVNPAQPGLGVHSEWPEKVCAAELNFVAGRKAKVDPYARLQLPRSSIDILSTKDGKDLRVDVGLFLERAECEISTRTWSSRGFVEAC